MISSRVLSHPAIPLDYGNVDRRDYPEIALYVNGVYHSETRWAKTQLIARVALAERLQVPLYTVWARVV